MIRRLYRSKAFSFTEYLVLIMILMSALLIFKDSILRAFSGRWKGVGDQFGAGRQYEPNDTIECNFDSVFTNTWYDATCLDNQRCPSGNKSCQSQAILLCQNDSCLPQPGDIDYVAPPTVP